MRKFGAKYMGAGEIRKDTESEDTQSPDRVNGMPRRDINKTS
jgi:hypothetical protein